MTERTPAEIVEAVAEFLEADKAMLPDNLTAPQAYQCEPSRSPSGSVSLRSAADDPMPRKAANNGPHR